jgi:hypothetical protein
MGDVARGITSFRQGLREGTDDAAQNEGGQTIEGESVDKSDDTSGNTSGGEK